jgi:hypothetical protein
VEVHAPAAARTAQLDTASNARLDVAPIDPGRVTEPRWLRMLAFLPAAMLAAFGGVGLLLAVAGVYRPLFAFPLGSIAFVALVVLAKPMLFEGGSVARRDHVIAVVGLVFVVAMGVWHVQNRAEHVLINRDGGSYATTGRWIASHGALTVEPRVGPFADEPTLRFDSFAVYDADASELTFQFAHLLPAVLAQAHRVGGDELMFATPGILAAAALLSLFVASWRFTRHGLIALVSVVAFAVVIPEISFSRDTYSEIPSQVLLFAALWILLDPDNLRRPRAALVAGLLIGMLQGVRIDALALMLGLPLLFAFAACRADASRRHVIQAAGACFVGLVPGVTLGFLDVKLRSSSYYAALSDEVALAGAAMVVSLLAAVALVVVVPFGRERLSRTQRVRIVRVTATAAGLAVVIVGFAAWFVRPRIQQLRVDANGFVAGLQTVAGVTVDPTRAYYERSLHWMSWYLGPVTVAAALIGAGLLAYYLIRGRERTALAVPLVLGPATVIYLWKASAVPDHVWVMRRFLVCAIPLLVLLAYWLVAWLARRGRAGGGAGATALVAAIALAVIGVAAPARAMFDIREMSEQDGYATAIRDACGIMGRDAAAVVLADRVGIVHEWIPQSLRSWCDVPVALLYREAPDRAETLQRLASGWADEGRDLFVVSGMADTITEVVPDAELATTRVVHDRHFLERTLLERPNEYEPQAFALALAPVPTG